MIVCKGRDQLRRMREANLIVARVLEHLSRLIQPGVTTSHLDGVAEGMIRDSGGEPAFKGYQGFPASVCASINEEIVHGIPSGRRLERGDIVSLDVGVRWQGYYGDAAWTFPVGKISPGLKQLLKVTRESLFKGIEQVVVGNRLSDISASVQGHIEKNGFSVVREFVGHGIGQHLHEDPQIPNFGAPGHGPRLQEGMVLAIEPMVNSRGAGARILEDKWTAVTTDGGYSAHFEHSVALTKDGPWILSRLD